MPFVRAYRQPKPILPSDGAMPTPSNGNGSTGNDNATAGNADGSPSNGNGRPGNDDGSSGSGDVTPGNGDGSSSNDDGRPGSGDVRRKLTM